MHNRRTFLLGVVAALPARASRTHQVSNPRELLAAIRAAGPGDTIVMADGEWKDCDLLFRAEGEPDRPITLRAGTPGKTIFSGRSRLSIAGRHLIVDGLCFKNGYAKDFVVAFRAGPDAAAHHCRMTRCTIVDYSPPDRENGTKWVSLYGAYNRVDRCFFSGKTNLGQTLVVWLSGEPNYHRIDRNRFGRRPPLGLNGGETIRVGTSEWSMSDSRTTVEYNLFEECNGEAEIVSSKSCGNTYRYNTFVNCEGALTLRHGNRCRVEGNFFFGNGKARTGGVRVIGEDHVIVNNYFSALAGYGSRSALTLMNGIPDSPLAGYFQVKRALVAFNTFVDCDSGLLIGRVGGEPKGGVLPPEDCVFADNIIVGRKGPLIRLGTPPGSIRWLGNIVHGADSGVAETAGLREVDPRLTQAADGLWRPSPGSPALGAAAGDYDFVRDDIDGQPRPAQKDAGCDQFSTAPVTRRPLTPEDAGPRGAG